MGNIPILRIVVTHGEPTTNNIGTTLRDFVSLSQSKISSTSFKKKDIHKHTWCAPGSHSLINYTIAIEKTLIKFVTLVYIEGVKETRIIHYLLLRILTSGQYGGNKKEDRIFQTTIII